jgi:hypothetical protein
MNALISWCRAERKIMLERLDSLESGRVRLGEVVDGGLVDQSQGWAQTLRTRVAELDVLMQEYLAAAESVRVGVRIPQQIRVQPRSGLSVQNAK